MTGAGHLIRYLIGTSNVGAVTGRIFGNADNQQFNIIIVIAASALLIAIGVTSNAVTERILLPSPNTEAESISGVLKSLVYRTLNLPSRIQAICWVQFWSWIGWFPFLFYSPTWVGETYYRYEHPTPPPISSSPTEGSYGALGNVGRLGSLALVLFSVITFTSSILLPHVVRSSQSFLSKATQSLLTRAANLQPDLVTAWLVSNFCFAAIMVWAPAVCSLAFAATLVALTGVSRAINSWAPFAEMDAEINRLASGEPTANGAPTNAMFPSGGERNGCSAVQPFCGS
jgi:solute carrier family 45, member 1/2/4